jgi:hypothetical protein
MISEHFRFLSYFMASLGETDEKVKVDHEMQRSFLGGLSPLLGIFLKAVSSDVNRPTSDPGQIIYSFSDFLLLVVKY